MRDLRTVIITGPTGSGGQTLCRLLLRQGITVYAVCRPDSPKIRRFPVHPALHIVPCDITSLRTLPALLPGVRADAFYHFAWAGNDGPNRDNMPLQTENIRCALDACEAAHALGCSVFVGAGSQAEYGRSNAPLTPQTPCFPEIGYGMAKLCAGQMTRSECHRLGMAHVWARILSVYGPFEQSTSMTISTITKLLHGEIPQMTPGEQIWDYLYADDAAEALFRMAVSGRDGAVYPLGSGSPKPLREYIAMLRDAVDPALPVAFGARDYAPNQIMYLAADISALQTDTGFTPQVPFAEGIRRTVAWVRQGDDFR
jgi:nucleoside-diphosphate-sugar epimerase